MPSAVLWFTIMTIVAALCADPDNLRLRSADLAVALTSAFEICSYVSSQYRANSVGGVAIVTAACLGYFFVRVTLGELRQVAAVAGLVGVGGAWLGARGIGQFLERSERLREAGLPDLIAFRATLMAPPAPWVPGEWFTLVLLTLCFALSFSVYLWLTHETLVAVCTLLLPAVLVTTLVLSLSRAAFGSVVLLCCTIPLLMIVYRVIPARQGSWILCSLLSALVLLLVCLRSVYPDVISAYTGGHTSQVRSGQGRVEIWERSLVLVRAHPVWGVGNSNAGLFLLSTAEQDDTTGFASRTFSLPVEVLVEKGIAGALLYGTLIFLLCSKFFLFMRASMQRVAELESATTAIRRRANAASVKELRAQMGMQCCFAAGVIAVLCRELTYASLMEHAVTLALFAILAALIVSIDGHEQCA